MATYKEMFGLSHSQFVKRGFGGDKLHPSHLEYLDHEENGPMLLVCVHERDAEDVEREWSEFQQGLRVGSIIQFTVDCPDCHGDGSDPSGEENCQRCEGYGDVAVIKTVGEEGTVFAKAERTGRWEDDDLE